MSVNGFTEDKQQGLVSLMTVMFFMIFIMLIAVGFLSLVTHDNRRSVDNDLSASALAAANSGVEEGKRILLYCRNNPSATGCSSALNSKDNCSVFSNGDGQALAASLGIQVDTNGQGVIGASSQYDQYFSCLTIQTKTDYTTNVLDEDSDVIQHLKTVNEFDRVNVAWSDDISQNNRTGEIGSWLKKGAWGAASLMPVLQVQVIPFVASDFNDLNGLESKTRTVYVVPCDGAATCNVTKHIGVLDARGSAGNFRNNTSPMPMAPITYAKCTIPPDGSSYHCDATLEGFNSSTSSYYVRVSLLYAQKTNLQITPYKAGTPNDPAILDDVQPWIDVTGRTNDVYRRVRAQVSYGADPVLPRHVIDSAASICKLMTITNAAATTTMNCP